MLIYLGFVATTYLIFEGDQAWSVDLPHSQSTLRIKGQAILTREWLFITIGHQGTWNGEAVSRLTDSLGLQHIRK